MGPGFESPAGHQKESAALWAVLSFWQPGIRIIRSGSPVGCRPPGLDPADPLPVNPRRVININHSPHGGRTDFETYPKTLHSATWHKELDAALE